MNHRPKKLQVSSAKLVDANAAGAYLKHVHAEDPSPPRRELLVEVRRPIVPMPISASRAIDLDGPGFLRLAGVLEIVPVSRSTWYAGVARGTYPAPVSLGGGRAKGYKKSDVKALVARLAKDGDHV